LRSEDKVPSGWVLKREFSSSCEHVFLPKSKRLPKNFKREKSFRWIAQEFAPLLYQLGEFRILLVGLEEVIILHSHSEKDFQWRWADYENPYSLAEIA
jgi:hypothetical protein